MSLLDWVKRKKVSEEAINANRGIAPHVVDHNIDHIRAVDALRQTREDLEIYRHHRRMREIEDRIRVQNADIARASSGTIIGTVTTASAARATREATWLEQHWVSVNYGTAPEQMADPVQLTKSQKRAMI